MPKQRKPEQQEQAEVAYLMAWVAGGVDVIGYLLLFHLFTAHMSGNSAVLGADLGQANWHQAITKAYPIPLFVIGVFLGALLVENALQTKAHSPFFWAYLLEAALLLMALFGGEWALHHRAIPSTGTLAFNLLAAFLTLAMGVQNSTLRRAGNLQFRTTFISGMLSNLAEEGAKTLLWLRQRTHGRSRSRFLLALRVGPRRKTARAMRFFSGIWIAYIAGGAMSGFAELGWQWTSLLLPIFGLTIIIALDRNRPLVGASSIEKQAG